MVTSWAADRLDYFRLGTDSACYHESWNGQAWSTYESLGGIFSGPLAFESWRPNRLDISSAQDLILKCTIDGGVVQLGVLQSLAGNRAVACSTVLPPSWLRGITVLMSLVLGWIMLYSIVPGRERSGLVGRALAGISLVFLLLFLGVPISLMFLVLRPIMLCGIKLG